MLSDVVPWRSCPWCCECVLMSESPLFFPRFPVWFSCSGREKKEKGAVERREVGKTNKSKMCWSEVREQEKGKKERKRRKRKEEKKKKENKRKKMEKRRKKIRIEEGMTMQEGEREEAKKREMEK